MMLISFVQPVADGSVYAFTRARPLSRNSMRRGTMLALSCSDQRIMVIAGCVHLQMATFTVKEGANGVD